MLADILIFFVAIAFVAKGATMATAYANNLASNFRLSKYTVGFIVVAIISILPETFIAISAALDGIPSLGLGTLFGSNIVDLTLVFAILVFYARRNLKIESKILKNHAAYPLLLILPLLLGWDGYYSRFEGLALIVAGAAFYYNSLKHSRGNQRWSLPRKGWSRDLILLCLSMVVLLVGSHYVISSVTIIAQGFNVSPTIIGMLIVGIGTTIPEMFFSMKAVKKRDDSMAVGDILGTVLADGTVVVGLIALISPFYFSRTIIYVTGFFMVAAAFTVLHFMHSGHVLTRKEAVRLVAFWLLFVITELVISEYSR